MNEVEPVSLNTFAEMNLAPPGRVRKMIFPIVDFVARTVLGRGRGRYNCITEAIAYLACLKIDRVKLGQSK